MMKENWVYCRGDIYCAKLDPVVGSEQGGIRPVIVIQNDTGNKHAPTLIVATVTGKQKVCHLVLLFQLMVLQYNCQRQYKIL